jgi:predicted nucleic-acid-binding Zn-ribbon protein
MSELYKLRNFVLKTQNSKFTNDFFTILSYLTNHIDKLFGTLALSKENGIIKIERFEDTISHQDKNQKVLVETKVSEIILKTIELPGTKWNFTVRRNKSYKITCRFCKFTASEVYCEFYPNKWSSLLTQHNFCESCLPETILFNKFIGNRVLFKLGWSDQDSLIRYFPLEVVNKIVCLKFD